jgi:hypothetical protein
MTTFTLQELNLPTTADQAVEQVTKEKWMEYGMNNPISASVTNEETLINMGKALANHELAHQQAQQNLLNAVPPQPTSETGTNVPDLASIINNICSQLQLLSTVISQTKAQPDAGENSLQECVATTLQQADWFKDMVKDEVESRVESEVEMYFERRFDPTDHFDFHDAVSDCVSDQIHDAVSDKIDGAVEEYMSNATITIQRS